VEHDSNLMLLDAERQQRADEHSHSIDSIHVQYLAEIAAYDAALRADGLDRLDRLLVSLGL
jgi:hypothetical protein